jgi:hypothetical protein
MQQQQSGKSSQSGKIKDGKKAPDLNQAKVGQKDRDAKMQSAKTQPVLKDQSQNKNVRKSVDEDIEQTSV